ncbi:MAG: NAD(P)-dependent dehydrogenase (short-subunit alcohol dehydrogenase family) [Cyclobacteriaceae bacterium]|jgi:NAD(P)-dependent dehydrogenase (short-subunit alcohol dehydrogenase family)
MPFYKEQDVPDQTGRTILITGANAGIGFEAARVLAGKGAQVLLGCRDQTKALDAIDRIKAVHLDADLAWVPLDLTSLSSVRAAAEQVKALPQLDILINNAGVMVPPKTLTEDGFELQFGVNHLGHFALTGLLLDTLRAQPDSRIVNVSSLAHHMGRIDFDDINAERSYDAMTRYGMSKLANMLFTLALQQRLNDEATHTIVTGCHPGIADTSLARYLPDWVNLAMPLMQPFFNSAAEGALPTLMAATRHGLHGGEYFGPNLRGETARYAGKAAIALQARDKAAAERLWDLSESMTGVTYS